MIQESPIKKRQINFDGTNKLKSAANNLPNVSTPTSGKVLPPPPRLSMKFPPPNPIGTPTTPIGGKNAGRGGKGGATPSPSPQKGGIHKNLHASPLFSRTMGDSEKSRLAEANTLRLQASVGAAGSTEVENDDVEEINVSRGIGSIMASKNKHGKKGKHQAKLAKAQAQKKAGIAMPAKMELQVSESEVGTGHSTKRKAKSVTKQTQQKHTLTQFNSCAGTYLLGERRPTDKVPMRNAKISSLRELPERE